MNILEIFKRKEVSSEEKREVIGKELFRICLMNDKLTDSVDVPAFLRAKTALEAIVSCGYIDFYYNNLELLKNIA